MVAGSFKLNEPSAEFKFKDMAPQTAFRTFCDRYLTTKFLLVWTLVGVLVGCALGGLLYNANVSTTAIDLIGYPGELMIRALQELILPLMICALMSGVFSLRHSKTGSGKVAKWAIMYYLLSMLVAIVIGIGMIYAVRPGRKHPFSSQSVGECKSKNAAVVNTTSTSTSVSKSTVDSLLKIGRDLIPTNIVSAAALPNYLGVMVFAIIFAFYLNNMGERAMPLINVIELLNDVIIKVIGIIIATTPVGVASLIASTVLKACNLGNLMQSLAEFVATILGSLLIHAFIGLPITLFFLARVNPIRAFSTENSDTNATMGIQALDNCLSSCFTQALYLLIKEPVRAFMPAFAMGIGTSSSAATMPVTMKCAEDYGCRSSIVKFVIPFGTNVNRDGTALYEAAAVIFICQAHGRALTAGNVVVIAITATLGAIGTASIPNAGLVTLITVLQATGFTEYLSDLSVLFAIDWILGMVRTAVNIWGDACATVVVNEWATRNEIQDVGKTPDEDEVHDEEAVNGHSFPVIKFLEDAKISL